MNLRTICQPASSTILKEMESCINEGILHSFISAVAYITTSGLQSLESKCFPSSTSFLHGERWLTSFDYLRTEPTALKSLMARPKAAVRVFDGVDCLARKGVPKSPFHPKLYIIKKKSESTLIIGSGNLSYSGLQRGIEAGLVLRASATNAAHEPIDNMFRWFDTLWENAAPLNEDLYSRYTELYESRENLLGPAPTEDDVAIHAEKTQGFTARDLQKLRMCKHFWIEAGNVTKNRGSARAGNQLMMKRLSRVFFGVPPSVVPENSPLDSVDISFRGRTYRASLTFSDNGMDKITLPIPGSETVASYDRTTLLFTRTGTRSFDLVLGNDRDVRSWRSKSQQIDAVFKMKKSRTAPQRFFGVF